MVDTSKLETFELYCERRCNQMGVYEFSGELAVKKACELCNCTEKKLRKSYQHYLFLSGQKQ